MSRASGRAVILVLGVALAPTGAGCASMCDAERLPAGGRVATPAALFTLAQYAARQDCCEVLHGLLSPATRQWHGEAMFCLWWDSESLKLPEPYEYPVAEILRSGVYDTDLEFRGQRFIYVRYQRAPRPEVYLQLLWVQERLPDGREEPRLALKEQFQPEPPARPVPWNAGRQAGD